MFCISRDGKTGTKPGIIFPLDTMTSRGSSPTLTWTDAKRAPVPRDNHHLLRILYGIFSTAERLDLYGALQFFPMVLCNSEFFFLHAPMGELRPGDITRLSQAHLPIHPGLELTPGDLQPDAFSIRSRPVSVSRKKRHQKIWVQGVRVMRRPNDLTPVLPSAHPVLDVHFSGLVCLP